MSTKSESESRNEPETEPDLQECQNCGSVWDAEDLREVEDLHMRVAPGEPMPSGECPSCGAVCHPHDEGDYLTRCPCCGDGSLFLVSFSGSCGIPVSRDGWSVTDGRALDTSDERFTCGRGCGQVPPEWVFKTLSRRDAVARMTCRNNAAHRSGGEGEGSSSCAPCLV